MMDNEAGPPESVERARRLALRRKIVAFATVLSVCLGVVVTRAVWHGRRALARGDAAMAAGHPRAAIDHWRRAARWYLPLAPHVDDAYGRLQDLALVAESKGDAPTALAAWRGVRNSVLATRSLYTPHSELLEPASTHIAALMADIESERSSLTGTEAMTRAEHQAWHHDRLARVPGPSTFWAVVALLGFALWLGGALLFALRGVSAEDRLQVATAIRAGVLVACGLWLWLMGLYLA